MSSGCDSLNVAPSDASIVRMILLDFKAFVSSRLLKLMLARHGLRGILRELA